MIAKLKTLSKDAWALVLLGAFSLLTHAGWFFTFKNFTSGDWWYISVERYKDFLQFSPIWVSNNLGGTSATPHFYLIRFFEGAFTVLGATFAIDEKLFFFLPIVFGSAFGAYLLGRVYFTVPLAFLGAVVYCFNTVFLFNHAGALTIEVVYALAPLAIYLFRRYIRELRGWQLVVTALLFAFMVAYEIRISFLVACIFFGLFICTVVTQPGGKWRFLASRLWPLGKLLLLVLLLHLFWLVPFVLNAGSSSIDELAGRGLFVSFSSVLNGLTLFHPFWTGARPATFVLQDIPAYMWLVPALATLGFVIKQKAHKELYFWMIVVLVGIFLVKQVNEPLILAYPWLYEHVPGFGAFRESSKFYVFIALGYMVLIPFGVRGLQTLAARVIKQKTVRRIAVIAPFAAALAIFFINAVPLLNGSFRTLTIPHDMPKDYATVNSFINSQKDYFRTLWVPVNSRWAADTNLHPNLLPGSLNQGKWIPQLGEGYPAAMPTQRDKIVQFLNNPSTPGLLSMASVKYVIVPMRDTASEDDFFRYYGGDRDYYVERLDQLPYLQKIDVGTPSVAVYQTKTFTPHVAAFTNLAAADAIGTPFEPFYDVVTKGLGNPFTFAAPAPKPGVPTQRVSEMFSSGSQQSTFDAAPAAKAYVKTTEKLRYAIHKNVLTLYARGNGQLLANGKPVYTEAAERVVGSAALKNAKALYLKIGDEVTAIPNVDGERQLGVADGDVQVYAADNANLIPNSSFEDGLWQSQVADCNNYDADPQISMQQVDVAHDGLKALQFKANKHTACTQTTFTNASGAPFLFSFDYAVQGGTSAGFEVAFNDPAGTVFRKDVNAEDASWRTYSTIITPPAGATRYTLRLLGYPDYRQRSYAMTDFDNFSATPLQVLATDPTPQPAYHAYDLPANVPLAMSYKSASQTAGPNLVGNGSFETGLWRNRVGDCNAYDDDPAIAMRQSNAASKGSKSLQLEARRHTACTDQTVGNIEENSPYIFSFDYQSPNAAAAGYYLRFNDPNKTIIQGDIPIKDKNWHTFTRQIKAPFDATQVSVAFYAYSDEYEQETNINRYDNVSLTKAADIASQFYLVEGSGQALAQPKAVTFDHLSATKRAVHITGATQPFYLSMSEAYHPGWRLEVNNARAQGWLPTDKPDVASAYHIKLNDAFNAWYVDPAQLCAHDGFCTKNADGSYNIELLAEFAPQRWVNAGSLVSGVTALGCIVYLVVAAARRHRNRRQRVTGAKRRAFVQQKLKELGR